MKGADMRTVHMAQVIDRKTEIVCLTHAQAILNSKARASIDLITLKLDGARVPWRLRGGLSLRGASAPPTVDRAVIEAGRVPGRGFFGEDADTCALDTVIRGLVEARVLWWATPKPPALHERPALYRLRHRSGLSVVVIARTPRPPRASPPRGGGHPPGSRR